jgi:hypothetical protein
MGHERCFACKKLARKRRAATKSAPIARLHLGGSRQPFEWPIRLNAARVSAVDFHQKVLCSSPHSLQVNRTRTCPWFADTRFGAPHFRHLLSIRVMPCFMVRFLRSKASFTRRSVSSRIACFDISYFLALDAIGHTAARGRRQMNLTYPVTMMAAFLPRPRWNPCIETSVEEGQHTAATV